MTDSTDAKKKIVVVALAWIFLLGMGVMGYRWLIMPVREKQKEQEIVKTKEQIIEKTGSSSKFKAKVSLVLDESSDYAIFRTSAFRNECAKAGLMVEITDDGGNCTNRYNALTNGSIDMAVFPVDSLYKTCAKNGGIPATIVDILTESQGSISLWTDESQEKNSNSTIFFVDSSSPETLAMMLSSVTGTHNVDFVAKQDFASLFQASPSQHKVYATGEPRTTKALSLKAKQLSSSKSCRHVFYNALVARRDFLIQNDWIVLTVVIAYRNALYQYRNHMDELVVQDALLGGTAIDLDQGKSILENIRWVSTQEAYAHFGMVNGSGLQHIEEICQHTALLLSRFGLIRSDPTKGKANLMYFDGIITRLFQSSWHPDPIAESDLKLTNKEWERLQPIPRIDLPGLTFPRGSARFTAQIESRLNDVLAVLQKQNSTVCFLVVKAKWVKGTDEAQTQANKDLAVSRGDSAKKWLAEKGVNPDRLHVKVEEAESSSRGVEFVIGVAPY